MRASLSDVLEGVDRCLPRGQYRVSGGPSAKGFVVHVDSVDRAQHFEFPVTRDELATDARAEWVAITIARAVKSAVAACVDKALAGAPESP